VDGKPERLSDREDQQEKRREAFHPPSVAAVTFGVADLPALILNSLFLRANPETGTGIRNVAPRMAAPVDGHSATTATSSGRPRLCDRQGGFYLRTKDVPGAGGLRGFCHSWQINPGSAHGKHLWFFSWFVFPLSPVNPRAGAN